MRLIDADALKASYIVPGTTTNSLCHLYVSLKDINNAPTIEAEPVRRGRWEYTGINTYDLSYGGTAYEPTYRCSACGHIHESYVRLDEPIMPEDADYPNYCPNCGARMEEQE